MIKVQLSNEILKYITEIDQNRYTVSSVKLPESVESRLRKNSKKKSSYASNKIEGNPLSEQQADEVIESDERKHFLRPEQEIRNYYLALDYLDKKAKRKEVFSKQLILDVQKLVEKGASKEKIGLRGPMPLGVLFAVYDSETGECINRYIINCNGEIEKFILDEEGNIIFIINYENNTYVIESKLYEIVDATKRKSDKVIEDVEINPVKIQGKSFSKWDNFVKRKD